MSFNSNIPQPTDLISNSQADILANFAFLGDTSTRSGVTVGGSTGGYYKLPNGLIIQYFLDSDVDDGDTIDFLTTFPTAVLGIWCQVRSNNSNVRSIQLNPGSITTSDFEVRCSAHFTSGVYFFAIGY